MKRIIFCILFSSGVFAQTNSENTSSVQNQETQQVAAEDQKTSDEEAKNVQNADASSDAPAQNSNPEAMQEQNATQSANIESTASSSESSQNSVNNIGSDSSDTQTNANPDPTTEPASTDHDSINQKPEETETKIVTPEPNPVENAEPVKTQETSQLTVAIEQDQAARSDSQQNSEKTEEADSKTTDSQSQATANTSSADPKTDDSVKTESSESKSDANSEQTSAKEASTPAENEGVSKADETKVVAVNESKQESNPEQKREENKTAKDNAEPQKSESKSQTAETNSTPVQSEQQSGQIEGQSELFKTNFANYIKKAKELSKKQMNDDEVAELTDKAMSLIDDMKNRAINEKLKAESISLKYLNGKDFPDLSEHQGNSEPDQKLVKFTIACYAMHKIMTKELVQKIIAKSPLEMVAVIKELSVFYQFISADPKNFGHGQFTERQDKNITVFATNDAILRIMKGIVYKNLLSNKKVYKMSRFGTYFYNESSANQNAVDNFIANLKRSSADDTRIAIYIPDASIDLTIDDSETSEFKTTARNYIKELNLSRTTKDKNEQQAHADKANELAKTLLGIIADVKINTSNKTLEFCKVLKQKREELQKVAESDNKKASLKAKRDIANYAEIEKFLKCNSKLLDSLYNDQEIFKLIMEKIPEFVPVIGREITVFLRALGLIIGSEDNFDKVIALLRDFARSSADGTYLLSPLLSVAIGQSQDFEFKKILKETDFSKLEICKYLQIK